VLTDEKTRRERKCEGQSGRQGALTDEETRFTAKETRRQRKDAAPGLAVVSPQQFRADNSPHLRLFYL